MEVAVTLATVIIPSVLTLLGCMINNNVQRTKEQHNIELQLQAVNDNYDKSTSLIEQRITELSDRVSKHNNLIERMYKCENRLSIIEHDLDDIKEDK